MCSLKSLIHLFIFWNSSVLPLAEDPPSKQKVLLHLISFWSENNKKCQKLLQFVALWLWSRIGSRDKISHQIQPSNLSSALLVFQLSHHLEKLNIVSFISRIWKILNQISMPASVLIVFLRMNMKFFANIIMQRMQLSEVTFIQESFQNLQPSLSSLVITECN